MIKSGGTIRIGTRGSRLARTQAGIVKQMLDFRSAAQNPLDTELVFITTTGDQQQEPRLAQTGGKGLFIKEIEAALLERRIDLAVHSAKDLPAQLAPGTVIAATPLRADPHDVWIGFNKKGIAEIPPGAMVGTSSLRRQAQLLAQRPDVTVQPLRGNIETRLRKVQDGVVAGTFLAHAGLERADLLPAKAVMLPLDEFIPAAGQGTLAIQARADDLPMLRAAQTINHAATFAALDFERRVVAALAGSCMAPIGVCAVRRGRVSNKLQGWIARAFVATPDGRKLVRATLLTEDPSVAGLGNLYDLLLATLRERGSDEILAIIGAL
ncbi:MAG: hydroxymethylbilane synthase [Phycisphaerae bacterium]